MTAGTTESVEASAKRRAILGLAVALVAGGGVATLSPVSALGGGEDGLHLAHGLHTAQNGPGGGGIS